MYGVSTNVSGCAQVSSFDPQKLFVGVIDLFAVLIPGVLLTYFLSPQLGTAILGEAQYAALAKDNWLAIFLSSFILGHFTFLIGSLLIDKPLFDPLRNANYTNPINHLAHGRKLSCRVTRLLASFMVSDKANDALETVLEIKRARLGTRDNSINAFQWCRTRLALENPSALARVERFEADSKFFRSFVVILPILAVIGFSTASAAMVIASVSLLPLAFWRYVDQRIKAINQAYWFVIALEPSKETSTPVHREGPALAGGVVFRKMLFGQPRYLLVQSSNKDAWVLPKGHIETGEEPSFTAVREVQEESGVWARVVCELEPMWFVRSGRQQECTVFLMKAVRCQHPSEDREVRWLGYAEAVKLATYPEARQAIANAEICRLKKSGQYDAKLLNGIRQGAMCPATTSAKNAVDRPEASTARPD